MPDISIRSGRRPAATHARTVVRDNNDSVTRARTASPRPPSTRTATRAQAASPSPNRNGTPDNGTGGVIFRMPTVAEVEAAGYPAAKWESVKREHDELVHRFNTDPEFRARAIADHAANAKAANKRDRGSRR